MKKSACRFPVPVTDNKGQPINPQVLLDLHRELLARFSGFTVHPTSLGRWQSLEGQVFQEEVVVYEVAVPEAEIPSLRDLVCRVGRQLGQLAMYFDAPPPSVEIIDLPPLASPAGNTGEPHEHNQGRKTRRRGKKDRPPG
jgi:hypothetical protein